MTDGSFDDMRFKSGQYRCVKCGYQTTPGMFELEKAKGGVDIYVCPECGGREILDFDSRRQVNPME